MLSGVGGFVLGLLFLGLGLFIYFRSQKGKEPGGGQDSIAFQRLARLCSQDVTGPVTSGFNELCTQQPIIIALNLRSDNIWRCES